MAKGKNIRNYILSKGKNICNYKAFGALCGRFEYQVASLIVDNILL